MNSANIFWYAAILLLLCACTRNNPLQEQEHTSSLATDEQFEAVADLVEFHTDQLLQNPDAVFHLIPEHPQTKYQQELFVYILSAMGYQLRENADLFQSIRYYEKAYQVYQKYELKDINEENDIIMPLANLYIRIDDPKKAIFLLEESLAKLQNIQNESSLINNLANAYLYDNEPRKAKSAILNRTRATSSLKPLLNNTLSSIYLEEGNEDSCAFYNAKALQDCQQLILKGDSALWYSTALTIASRLTSQKEPLERALRLLDRAFPVEKAREKAKINVALADYYKRQKALVPAMEYYKDALRNFPSNLKYQLDYTYTQALTGIGDCYSLDHVDSATFYYQWAIENDYRTQQLIIAKENQIRNNIGHKILLEKHLTLLEKQVGTPENKSKIVEKMLWSIELSKARMLITEINRSQKWVSYQQGLQAEINQIRLAYQELNASQDEKQKTEMQKHIKKLLLTFQLSENYFEKMNSLLDEKTFIADLKATQADYYSYYIHQDSGITVIGLIEGKPLYKKIEDHSLVAYILDFKSTYFGNTSNNYNLSPTTYQKKAFYIAQQLLPNFSNSQSNIFVSLDGILHGLPFDALWNTNFLVKTHNFSYLNSFLLFDMLSHQKTENVEISILHRSVYPKPFASLDFVQEEVKLISDQYTSKMIAPEMQNDSILSQNFASHNIIHIAAHAILEEQKEPYLYLHNKISTSQLAYYQMQTPLVFLSACNTGNGENLPSEGTESIHRVFLSRSVPSVISTYWFANDELMVELTSNFYQNLYKIGKPMEALGTTKRDFLNRASHKQQNPWYWANINYAGVNNELGLKKTSNLVHYVCFGILFGIVCSLFAFFKNSCSRLHYFKKEDNKTDNKLK